MKSIIQGFQVASQVFLFQRSKYKEIIKQSSENFLRKSLLDLRNLILNPVVIDKTIQSELESLLPSLKSQKDTKIFFYKMAIMAALIETVRSRIEEAFNVLYNNGEYIISNFPLPDKLSKEINGLSCLIETIEGLPQPSKSKSFNF